MSGPFLLIFRLLLAAALYAFLGWALWTLWKDLKRQEQMLAARKAPPLTLVIEGTDQAFHFSRPIIRIGRDLSCDCCLDDKTVSIQHALLSFHHKQWWLEDLGSTNGTFLNQDAVTEPVVVTQDDSFSVGQVNLKIRIA